MSKVLLAFYNGITDDDNSNAMPLFYQAFVEGLDKAGNEVVVYSHKMFGIDFTDINQALKNDIIDFNPDICFIFNNCFYNLSNIVECPIIIYEVDSPRYFSNKEDIIRNPNRYLYFIAQTDSREVLKNEFYVSENRIFSIPFYSEIYAENVMYNKNISFIGSRFPCNEEDAFIRFIKENPNHREKRMFLSCINEIKKNPYIMPVNLVEICQITSEKVARNVNIGSILMSLSGEKRIEVLSCLVDLGLELYGTKNWGNEYYYNLKLNVAYHNENVYSIEHNQQILNTSKIGINVSHIQATSGFPWRVMDIMASNSCLVTDYHSDFEQLFPEISKIIPTYETAYEAREQCEKLLKDEHCRIDIVKQCNEIINQKYRFKHLLSKMEQYSNVRMHI